MTECIPASPAGQERQSAKTLLELLPGCASLQEQGSSGGWNQGWRLRCSTAIRGKDLSTAETHPSGEETRPRLWDETLVSMGPPNREERISHMKLELKPLICCGNAFPHYKGHWNMT